MVYITAEDIAYWVGDISIPIDMVDAAGSGIMSAAVEWLISRTAI